MLLSDQLLLVWQCFLLRRNRKVSQWTITFSPQATKSLTWLLIALWTLNRSNCSVMTTLALEPLALYNASSTLIIILLSSLTTTASSYQYVTSILSSQPSSSEARFLRMNYQRILSWSEAILVLSVSNSNTMVRWWFRITSKIYHLPLLRYSKEEEKHWKTHTFSTTTQPRMR